MDKLRKSIQIFKSIIKNPRVLNLLLEDNEYWYGRILKKNKEYTPFPLISLQDLDDDFLQTINPYSFMDGGSLITDLALLKILAKAKKDCTFFEIGTWRGESVANLSEDCSECFTMDLPDNEKQALGMSKEYIALHAILSKHLKNVTHIKANSFHYDFSSLNRKFDLIFIDGDHHYKAVVNDTKLVFQHLVHDNTVVVWHDYAYNPGKVRNEVFAAISDSVESTKHHHLYYVKNTLCAVYLPQGILNSDTGERQFEITIRYV